MIRVSFVVALMASFAAFSGCSQQSEPAEELAPPPENLSSDDIGRNDHGESAAVDAPNDSSTVVPLAENSEEADVQTPPRSVDEAIGWLREWDDAKVQSATAYLTAHGDDAVYPLVRHYLASPMFGDIENLEQSTRIRNILIELGPLAVTPLEAYADQADAAQRQTMMQNAYNAASGGDGGSFAPLSDKSIEITVKCRQLLEAIREAQRAQSE